jgi:hypothetical protein
MVDADLARLYGVETRALNQAVRRNRERFPEEFVFQLTLAERDEVITICDHLRKLKFSASMPYAFTEHGALMAASVLNSARAIQVSLYVIRAFVSLRNAISTQKDLADRLDKLESRYDSQFKVVFDAIRELMRPPESPRRRIGFVQDE